MAEEKKINDDESFDQDMKPEEGDSGALDRDGERDGPAKKQAVNQEQTSGVIKGLYRCHTGNKYQVLFTATSTEDHASQLVVYRGLADGRIWVRPQEEFLGQKEIKGQLQPRFELLEVAPEEEENWEHKYKRALADYQNLIKQQEREQSDFRKYVLTDFLQDILPVYDHLKMSLRGLDQQAEANPWLAGVRHVLKQFQDLLGARGVEEIKTLGAKFDHDTMEAVDGQGEMVEQEIMPGYKLNGRLIRAAKVIVGSGQSEANKTDFSG